MFEPGFLDEVDELEEQWRKDFAELYPGKEEDLNHTTASGIPIKAVYTPLDLKDMPYRDLGMPGEYPYTRGVNHVPYKIKPWQPVFLVGFGSGADGYERQKFLRDLGLLGSKQRLPEIDLPTKLAYDPDHPFSRGRVGAGGVSLSTIDDLDELIGDEDPAEIDFILSIPLGSLPMLAIYIVLAERRGVTQDKLRGCFSNNSHQTFHTRMAGFPPHGSQENTIELIKYCRRNMPMWRTLNLSAYNLRESGLNAVQEIALIFGFHITIVEDLIKEGLDPDDFVRSFMCYMDFEGDFFEELAKLRAFRRIWAKINKERFGCKSPESFQLDIHIQTGGLPLTKQQPLNNIMRIAIQALGAALGGVNTMHTCSYDEAIEIPTQEAVSLAVRTQQILFHELNIDKVCDPLAGSYYVEYLTNKLEEEANKILEEITRPGEFLKRWENGWFRKLCYDGAVQHEDDIEKKKVVLVGLNEYVAEEETTVPIFSYDLSTEERVVEKLSKFKRSRDNIKVEKALSDVERAPKGELVPTLIDAVKAGATHGEMGDVLRKRYGWMHYY